jgi:hypothetical protein
MTLGPVRRLTTNFSSPLVDRHATLGRQAPFFTTR